MASSPRDCAGKSSPRISPDLATESQHESRRTRVLTAATPGSGAPRTLRRLACQRRRRQRRIDDCDEPVRRRRRCRSRRRRLPGARGRVRSCAHPRRERALSDVGRSGVAPSAPYPSTTSRASRMNHTRANADQIGAVLERPPAAACPTDTGQPDRAHCRRAEKNSCARTTRIPSARVS
jgi:hypothetical protein